MASRDDVIVQMQTTYFEKHGVQTTKKDLDEAFNLVLDSIHEVVMNGDGTPLRTSIGTFRRKEVAARTARNPKTGEPVEVPAKVVLALKASSAKAEEITEAEVEAEVVKAKPKVVAKPAVKAAAPAVKPAVKKVVKK